MVVLLPPVFEEELGLEQGVEGLHVEELVAEVRVERLDVRVLPGSPGLDVGDRDSAEAAPVLQRLGGQLGAVVAADVGGGAAPPFDDSFERLDSVVRGDATSRWDGQCFAGVLVGDRQDLDWPTIGGAVDEEVERPDLIGAGRGHVAGHPPFASAPTHLGRQAQALVPPEPLHPLAVTRPAFPS